MTRTRSPCPTNSGGCGYFISTSLDAFLSTAANSVCPRYVPASGQPSPGMIHSISSATNASRSCSLRLPIAAKKSFTIWTFFSMLIKPLPSLTSSESDLNGRFGTILLGPIHTLDYRLLLLLDQVLEDELTPS